MVPEIVWTSEAQKNLKEIADYISRDSEFYAEKTIYLIYQACLRLRDYPEIGMPIPIKSEFTLRRILVKSYRVVYCFHNNKIYIASVYKQAKPLPNNFDFLTDYFG